MPTVLADLKTRLNVWLRDAQDQTFSDVEKTELLTEAINDPYVYTVRLDTSLTTSSALSYTAPTGLEAIYDMGINVDGTGIFQRIGRSAYELIGDTIYFSATGIPSGKTIQIKGKFKLTAESTDFPVKVQEYILHRAMIGAFELLKTSLTTRFVKNDMTMGDVINSISTHEKRVRELRQVLHSQYLLEL